MFNLHLSQFLRLRQRYILKFNYNIILALLNLMLILIITSLFIIHIG